MPKRRVREAPLTGRVVAESFASLATHFLLQG
jgi:hypothetical protein